MGHDHDHLESHIRHVEEKVNLETDYRADETEKLHRVLHGEEGVGPGLVTRMDRVEAAVHATNRDLETLWGIANKLENAAEKEADKKGA